MVRLARRLHEFDSLIPELLSIFNMFNVLFLFILHRLRNQSSLIPFLRSFSTNRCKYGFPLCDDAIKPSSTFIFLRSLLHSHCIYISIYFTPLDYQFHTYTCQSTPLSMFSLLLLFFLKTFDRRHTIAFLLSSLLILRK